MAATALGDSVSVQPADLLGPYQTVFDVGAFQGDFARACLAEWPECTVYSFEPLADEPADRKRLDGRWSWHGSALGTDRGWVTINRNVFLPSSSVLPMLELHETAFPYTKGSEQEQVPLETVADHYASIVPPALLKIDVQGYELEVLVGAEGHLNRFDAVVLEVSHEPLYSGAPTPEQLADFLEKAGFVLYAVVDRLYHPGHGGRLLQSDELWVRPWKRQ